MKCYNHEAFVHFNLALCSLTFLIKLLFPGNLRKLVFNTIDWAFQKFIGKFIFKLQLKPGEN